MKHTDKIRDQVIFNIYDNDYEVKMSEGVDVALLIGLLEDTLQHIYSKVQSKIAEERAKVGTQEIPSVFVHSPPKYLQ